MQSEQILLKSLEKILFEQGKSIVDFAIQLQDPLEELKLMYNDYQIDLEIQKANEMESNLTVEQRKIYDEIVDAMTNRFNRAAQDTNYFLKGIGGAGKSYLQNAILHRVRGNGCIALAVASSGIASQNLIGGRTAHSTFKIPINITKDSFCNIKIQSSLAKFLKEVSLVIWDEAGSSHCHQIDALERTIKDIVGEEHFGRIVFLFSGDLRQTFGSG
jgi:predicted GTPase